MPQYEMIGLKRGTVSLLPTQESWKHAFEDERARLLSATGDLVRDIHHVGSTSVPGLDAKPIIDIALVVDSFDTLPRLSECLVCLGWIDRGWVRDDNYLFVIESAPEVRTHHLHVVEPASPQLNEYIVFKEVVLKDSTVNSEYAALKKQLAETFPDDRKSYTAAKDDFIRAVLAQNGVVIWA